MAVAFDPPPVSVPATWRSRVARALWHAHPARPGPEYALLRQSQWWPYARVAQYQADALRRLLASALQVPFYRERLRAAGVGPEDIRSIADIGRLPVLERRDLDRLGIAGLRRPGSWGVRAQSSGSTARPVEFLWPLTQMRWLDAGEARARAWLGAQVGQRRVEVRCRPLGAAQALSAVLLNTHALHAPSIAAPGVVAHLARSIEARPPSMVWGVSNALYAVALALLDQGRRVKVGACVSGGNHLHPHYREALTEAFGCRVFERYATMETGVIAHECPEAGALHVPAEGLVAEIVRADGSPAAPGETGDVLVTSLRNHATPLIRYRVGDQATVPPSPQCPCGRGLPLFGTVAGRSGDFLRTAAGGRIGAHAVIAAARPGLAGSVVDLQALQDKAGRLRILVVQRDSPAPAAERERIGTVMQALVGAREPPQVERVDAIALTPGGKLRTIIAPVEAPA